MAEGFLQGGPEREYWVALMENNVVLHEWP